MDLITASQIRLPLAVELPSGDIRLACEVVRLRSGRVVWCEYTLIQNVIHLISKIHILENQPHGDVPEWQTNDLRFFVIGRNDVRLMSYWQAYEAARIRGGTDRLLGRLREFSEAEYGHEPEVSAA